MHCHVYCLSVFVYVTGLLLAKKDTLTDLMNVPKISEHVFRMSHSSTFSLSYRCLQELWTHCIVQSAALACS